MRYVLKHINPKTGKESYGTNHTWIVDYANVKNVIRFGLRKEGLPPGQYNIYLWPSMAYVTLAYKVA